MLWVALKKKDIYKLMLGGLIMGESEERGFHSFPWKQWSVME